MHAPLTRFGPTVLTTLSPQAGRGKARARLRFATGPAGERACPGFHPGSILAEGEDRVRGSRSDWSDPLTPSLSCGEREENAARYELNAIAL